MKTLTTLCTAIALLAICFTASAQNDRADGDNTPIAVAETNTLRWEAVYPVPVTSLLTLSVNSPTETAAVVRLIDVLGRTAFERPVALLTGNNRFEVNMDDMPAGIYQLILQTDNKRLVYKLLKGQ